MVRAMQLLILGLTGIVFLPHGEAGIFDNILNRFGLGTHKTNAIEVEKEKPVVNSAGTSLAQPPSIRSLRQQVNGIRHLFKSKKQEYELLRKKTLKAYAKDNHASLSDFEHLRNLGAGAFGNVTLARHKASGRLYALKVTKDLIKDEDDRASLLREKDIMIGINFPFIIKLDYAFEQNNRLVMAMEYAENGDLKGLIQQRNNISKSDIQLYAAQMSLALAYLHHIGILHRDLKPENVLLDAEFNAKVADFGLSKKAQPILCRSRTFCGTSYYMAPEIRPDLMWMQQSAYYTRAVDWFALGVLLVQLAGGNIKEEQERFIKDIRKPGAEIYWPSGMDTDHNLRDLCSKLLSYKSKDRLGGERHDFWELMKHPYFAGMDWLDVYNGRVKPSIPPPPPKANHSSAMDITDIWGSVADHSSLDRKGGKNSKSGSKLGSGDSGFSEIWGSSSGSKPGSTGSYEGSAWSQNSQAGSDAS